MIDSNWETTQIKFSQKSVKWKAQVKWKIFQYIIWSPTGLWSARSMDRQILQKILARGVGKDGKRREFSEF